MSATGHPVVAFPDEDGDFALTGDGFGNPGCDLCGTADADVRVSATYLCTGCSGITGRQLVITLPVRVGEDLPERVNGIADLIQALLVDDDRLAGRPIVTPVDPATGRGS